MNKSLRNIIHADNMRGIGIYEYVNTITHVAYYYDEYMQNYWLLITVANKNGKEITYDVQSDLYEFFDYKVDENLMKTIIKCPPEEITIICDRKPTYAQNVPFNEVAKNYYSIKKDDLISWFSSIN